MLSVKGLISKIYKELIEQVNSIANKQTFQFKNRQRIRTFFNKSLQVINKPMKRCLTNHQENANQNCSRYHLIPVRMVIIKKDKKEQVLVGMWISASHYGKQYGGFSEMNDRTTVLYSHSTSGYLSKGNENTKLKRYMHLHVYWVWYAKFKMWKQRKCSSFKRWIKKCGIHIQWSITQP